MHGVVTGMLVLLAASDELLVDFTDLDADVRADAAEAAGGSELPLFVHPLRGLLADPDEGVRAAAAAALGELGVPRTAGDLLAVLASLRAAADDGRARVRFAAIRALGRFPFPEVRQQLVRLRAERPELREVVAEALALQRSPEAAERLEQWLRVSSEDLDDAARWGVDADSVLLPARALLDPSWELHPAAIELLAAWPEPAEAVPFLRHALREPGPTLRAAAARGLAAFAAGSTDARTDAALALVTMARDPAPEVRRAALFAAGAVPAPETTAALVERVVHEREPVLRTLALAQLALHSEAAEAIAAAGTAVPENVRADLVSALAPRPGDIAGAALIQLLLAADSAAVSTQALAAVRARPDDDVLDPLLTALTAVGARGLGRLRAALHHRDAAEISERLLEALAAGADVVALLGDRSADEVVPGLLEMLENDPAPAPRPHTQTQTQTLRVDPDRAGPAPEAEAAERALAALDGHRGPAIAQTLAHWLARHPDSAGSAAALRQLCSHPDPMAVEPLLELLDDPGQSANRDALVRALAGRSHKEIARAVGRATAAEPGLARDAVPVLAGQDPVDAIPELARVAQNGRFHARARAQAVDALVRFGGDGALAALEGLARDRDPDVRFAARNGLHALAPGAWAAWDTLGRAPLVAAAGGFGAATLLLARDIAAADGLNAVLTGGGGLVLGGASAYLLALDRDVTLGDAGAFVSLGLWGSFGGWGLGGLLTGDPEGIMWATLAGEALGLGAGAVAASQGSWDALAVLRTELAAIQGGALASMGLALGSREGFRADGGYAFLLGGALGLAPVALAGRDLDLDDGSVTLLGAATAGGAWLGGFFPGLLRTPDPADVVFGVLAGQSAGYFGGLLISQFAELDASDVGWGALGTAAGASLGAGVGLIAEPLRGRPTLALVQAGSVAGAFTLGLLGERLELHGTDAALVVLATAGGLYAGGNFRVRAARETFATPAFPGGMLLGAGAGLAAGLALTQLVDLSREDVWLTLAGTGLFGFAGIGLGSLVPGLEVEEQSLLSGGTAALGAGLGIVLTPHLRLDGGAAGLMGVGAVAGGLFGAFLPAYWHGDDALPSTEVTGGLALGAAAGTLGAVAASQWLVLDPGAILAASVAGLAGAATGAGAGLVVPALRTPATVALLHAGGLAGLGLALASPGTVHDAGPGLPLLLALHGAWHGALVPSTWRSGEVPDPERTGGILLGGGLGVIAGTLLGSSLALAPDDLVESALLATAANGLGGGLGLLIEDGGRTGVALVQGLGLAGLATGLGLAPRTSYEPADAATLAAAAAAFGWFGAWLPYTFADARPSGTAATGGGLAGVSFGLLAGAALAQLGPAAPGDAGEALVLAAAGSGLGAGLGLLAGASDRVTVGLMEATGLGALAGAAALAPLTSYDADDLALAAAATALGAWHGGLLPAALVLDGSPAPASGDAGPRQGSLGREGDGARAATRSPTGVLLGASLGLGAGLIGSQLVNVPAPDTAEVLLLASAANAVGAGLAGALEAGGELALATELAGLAGLAGAAFAAPRTTYDGEDAGIVAFAAAAGAWHGSWAPELWGARDREPWGVLLGTGAGLLGGAALAQVPGYALADALEGAVFGAAGDAVGAGLGLLLDTGARADAWLVQGLGLPALAASLAFAPATDADPGTVALLSAIGAWHGAWLPALHAGGAPALRGAASVGARDSGGDAPIDDTAIAGGALLGAGLGAFAGHALGLLAPPEAETLGEASVLWVDGSALGAGLGLLAGTGTAAVALMDAGGLLGLAAGLAVAPHTSYDTGDRALITGAMLSGAAHGLTLPTLLGARGASAHWGGALAGAALGGLGAGAAAQVSSFTPVDVLELELTTLLGDGAGYGLGLLLPGASSALRLGLLDAGGLGGAAAAAYFAPRSDYDGVDLLTMVNAGALGAWTMAWLPALWNGPTISAVPDAEAGGGLLFGTALGLGAGALLSQAFAPTPEDNGVVALGAASGALAGSGLGMLFSEDDRLAVGLMEALTLGAAAGVGATARDLHFDGADLLFGATYVGYLGWHELGVSLLLGGTDRQAAGATMAIAGLGSITGMYLTPYVDLELTDVLMLFAGNVWGSWIGGWGAAIVKDRMESEFHDGRRTAGLYLLGTVLGSDLGLALTGAVVGELLEVDPIAFAWINITGLGGMLAGMLTAGFIDAGWIKEGNVIGSAAGLATGAVVTALVELPGSGAAAPVAQLPEAADPAVAVDTWFPGLRVEPTDEGDSRYLFTLTGTWR